MYFNYCCFSRECHELLVLSKPLKLTAKTYICSNLWISLSEVSCRYLLFESCDWIKFHSEESLGEGEPVYEPAECHMEIQGPREVEGEVEAIMQRAYGSTPLAG